MKPFELVEPSSLRDAIGCLDRDDPAVRPISGGTALMLMMKSGLFQPIRLVSLRGIEPQYSAIATGEDGSLTIGAVTPLAVIERSAAVARHAPVITETLRRLSNRRVRNVAMLGGHLAHADPHLDLPPVLIALGAEIVIAGPAGERRLPLAQLYTGYYETVLRHDEVIASVIVPQQTGWSAVYRKCTARSADDWPALGIAVALRLEGGIVAAASIVIGAATETPTRLTAAETALAGSPLADDVLGRAGEAAAAEAPIVADQHGSAAYKKQLLRVHLGRAARRAFAQATGAPSL